MGVCLPLHLLSSTKWVLSLSPLSCDTCPTDLSTHLTRLTVFSFHLISMQTLFCPNLLFLIKDNTSVLPAPLLPWVSYMLLHPLSIYHSYYIYLLLSSLSHSSAALMFVLVLSFYPRFLVCILYLVVTHCDVSQLVPLRLCFVTSSCSLPIMKPSSSPHICFSFLSSLPC